MIILWRISYFVCRLGNDVIHLSGRVYCTRMKSFVRLQSHRVLFARADIFPHFEKYDTACERRAGNTSKYQFPQNTYKFVTKYGMKGKLLICFLMRKSNIQNLGTDQRSEA